jgi:hypothetical protein
VNSQETVFELLPKSADEGAKPLAVSQLAWRTALRLCGDGGYAPPELGLSRVDVRPFLTALSRGLEREGQEASPQGRRARPAAFATPGRPPINEALRKEIEAIAEFARTHGAAGFTTSLRWKRCV